MNLNGMKMGNNINKTIGKRKKYFFIKGLIHILDSIIPIITLGYFYTDFSYQFTKWATFRSGWNN